MTQLQLKDYSSVIRLEEDFSPTLILDSNIEQIVDELLEILIQEPGAPKDLLIPNEYERKRNLLRGLLNIREPKAIHNQFLNKINSLLQLELREKGIYEVEKLKPISTVFPNNPFTQSDKLILWKGDITQLNADAIVNAANNQLLGCFQPLHACIDNAIHSAAGPQLRDDCNKIMTAQAELEETGNAKITRAYNLPSRYVLHTVGPIVQKGTQVTNKQKEELASCYTSCLDLANEVENIKTIAFCAISTGVYGFPITEAAFIAVKTVDEWLAAHPNRFDKIIFNVFSESDYLVYQNVFMDQVALK